MSDRYRWRGFGRNERGTSDHPTFNEQELIKAGALTYVEAGKTLKPREASKILLFFPVAVRLWLLKEIFTNYAEFYDEKGGLKEEDSEEKGEPLVGVIDFTFKGDGEEQDQ